MLSVLRALRVQGTMWRSVTTPQLAAVRPASFFTYYPDAVEAAQSQSHSIANEQTKFHII